MNRGRYKCEVGDIISIDLGNGPVIGRIAIFGDDGGPLLVFDSTKYPDDGWSIHREYPQNGPLLQMLKPKEDFAYWIGGCPFDIVSKWRDNVPAEYKCKCDWYKHPVFCGC